MIHGFHRQCQPFQLFSGPPWTHSSSGAGVVAVAPSGSTSQARSGVPSSAVVVTSVRLPGSAGAGGGRGQRNRDAGGIEPDRGGRGVDGRPQRVDGAVRADDRVGVRAVVVGQPGDGAAGEVDAEERRAPAVVGGHDEGRGVGSPGERGDPAVPARGDVARRRRRSDRDDDAADVRGLGGGGPAGARAGDPPAVRGDGDRARRRCGRRRRGARGARPARRRPAATQRDCVRDAPCGSSTRHVVTTVDPSGVTSYSAWSSAPPGVGVRSVQVSGRRRPARRRSGTPRAAGAGPGRGRGPRTARACPRAGSRSPWRPCARPARAASSVGGDGAGQGRRRADDGARVPGDDRPAQPTGPGADRHGLAAARGQPSTAPAAGRRRCSPGTGRAERNSRSPAGVNAASCSPGSPRVRRAGRPGAGRDRPPTARCGSGCRRRRAWRRR